jgi:tetratricopeptide (TPR) repeat protein
LLEAENTHVDKRTQSVRIVLLARTADTWWQQLRLESQRIDLPLEATPLAPVEESREDSFRRAVKAFATNDEHAKAIRTPELKEGYYRSVLFVHMRALLATRSQQNPTTESQLLDQILELEKRQWHKEKVNNFSQQDLDAAIAQIMTVVTLGYTLNNKGDLRELLKEIPYTEHLGNEQPALDGLAERLRELYPGSLYLEPLRPDILGEHLLERTLLPKEDDPQTRSKLLSLVFDKEQSNPASAVEVLIRLMQRREQSGVMLFVETYRKRRDNILLAKQITYQFPVDLPVSLSELAVSAGVIAYQNSDNIIERAIFANNLGISFVRIGKYETALDLWRGTLEIRRELAKERPKVYRPHVATTLNNLGTALSDLNQLEEAVEAYQEALEIRREMAEKRPQVYFPQIAETVANMGHIYKKPETVQTALACWVLAFYIYVTSESHRATTVLLWLHDCKQNTPNFDTLLNDLFPSGDVLLEKATGQDFGFYKEISAELVEQILSILNQSSDT